MMRWVWSFLMALAATSTVLAVGSVFGIRPSILETVIVVLAVGAASVVWAWRDGGFQKPLPHHAKLVVGFGSTLTLLMPNGRPTVTVVLTEVLHTDKEGVTATFVDVSHFIDR